MILGSFFFASMAVGGALLYGQAERQGPLMATVLAGFAGVVMMLRPTLEQNQLFAGLIGLLSGLGAALAYMQVTALGKVGEPEGRTVFYFSIGSAITGLVGIFFTGLTFRATVIRHCVCRLLQSAAVRRQHSTDRLGRHGADRRQWSDRHGAAHAHPA